MKKLKLLLSLSILFFTFYSCNEQLEISNLESLDSKAAIIKPFESLSQDIPINYCGEPVECTLIAGQSIDAGTVTIMNDGVNLYVKVYSKAGFQDAEENIKMWIGIDLPSKRPPAGKFPYKVTESSNTHIFKILLSSIDGWVDDECEQQFYIIVHADVLTVDGDPDSGETAFGGCEAGNGKAWWYYMKYTTQCCDEEEKECMDAFAFKYLNPEHSICLDYADNGTKHLVWSNKFNFKYLENRNYQFTLFANAEDCRPQAKDGTVIDSEAIVVGYINITMFSEGVGDGIQLYTTISYHITNNDYELSDVNLYLKDIEKPNDLNPSNGDYNYDVDSPEWDSSTTTFVKLSWPGAYNAWDTFVIPHAKVCRK